MKNTQTRIQSKIQQETDVQRQVRQSKLAQANAVKSAKRIAALTPFAEPISKTEDDNSVPSLQAPAQPSRKSTSILSTAQAQMQGAQQAQQAIQTASAKRRRNARASSSLLSSAKKEAVVIPSIKEEEEVTITDKNQLQYVYAKLKAICWLSFIIFIISSVNTIMMIIYHLKQ